MNAFYYRWSRFHPGKPRSPWLRLAFGLLGLVVLAFLLVFGLFIGLGMLAFAAVRRLSRAAPAKRPDDAIEGEYTLVRKPGIPLGIR